MPYIAKLKSKTQDAEKMKYVITFDDGVSPFEKEFIQLIGSISLESLKSQINVMLNNLNNPVSLSTGTIDTTPATVTIPQSEIDKSAWLLDWKNLMGANQLIAQLNTSGQTAKATAIQASVGYTNLAARVANNFIPAYIPFL